MGEMVQGLESINWWHEIDRENVLRLVEEME